MASRRPTPILLLGYNRPEQLRGLIKSLRVSRPSLLLVAVDGPKPEKLSDNELVTQTQACVDEITWNATVVTRFRETNLGLRRAVVDAVTWATALYGKTIVFEDDFRPGPETVAYLEANLLRYESHPEIAHINGYNPVPIRSLSHPFNQSRKSKYVESYAWATWESQWKNYDDSLSWASSATICDIKKIVGSIAGAIRWKINFADADRNRVDTWAYRWIASIWSQNKVVIAPNRNLGVYAGHEGGTHTRTAVYRSEPEIEQISHLGLPLEWDLMADRYLAQYLFGENVKGIIRGGANSLALEVIKQLNVSSGFVHRAMRYVRKGSQ